MEPLLVLPLAAAVPADTPFPLTDDEARPIDFEGCLFTPEEQIMVTELE